MNKTSIEWTDSTWSPLRVYVKHDAAQIAREKGYTSLVQIAERMAGSIGPHCEHVSPGCENCYAGSNNHRCLPNNGTGLPYDRRSRDLTRSFVDEHILDKPLRTRKAQKIFVENQSDLFGEWYSLNDLEKVWRVICGALHKGHTFQILTKRPERMKELIPVLMNRVYGFHWKMPDGIWLGVSVENQKAADERIPLLLQTPAAVRFISAEPLLGPVSLRWKNSTDFGIAHPRHKFPEPDANGRVITDEYDGLRELNWVIVGGESGPGARPMHPDWVRSLRDQCQAARVPFFFKQWGEWAPAWPVRQILGGEDANNKSIALHFDGLFDMPDCCSGTYEDTTSPDENAMEVTRIGKKAAGALLDGREWREFPEVRA